PAQSVVAHVTHHADDFNWFVLLLLVIDPNFVTNRVGIAEVELRHGLIDDGHPQGRGSILRTEFTASQERYAESMKIIAAYLVPMHYFVAIACRDIALDFHLISRLCSAEQPVL